MRIFTVESFSILAYMLIRLHFVILKINLSNTIKFNTLLCHKTLSHYEYTDSKARVLWPIDFGQRIPLSPPNTKKGSTET